MNTLFYTFDGLLAAHGMDSARHQYRPSGCDLVHGYPAESVPIGMPEVVLFADSSTPTRREVRPEAPRLFDEAVARLLREDIEFVTVAHPTWNTFALRWTRQWQQYPHREHQ